VQPVVSLAIRLGSPEEIAHEIAEVDTFVSREVKGELAAIPTVSLLDQLAHH
jgi:hypothetical protein